MKDILHKPRAETDKSDVNRFTGYRLVFTEIPRS